MDWEILNDKFLDEKNVNNSSTNVNDTNTVKGASMISSSTQTLECKTTFSTCETEEIHNETTKLARIVEKEKTRAISANKVLTDLADRMDKVEANLVTEKRKVEFLSSAFISESDRHCTFCLIL